MTRGVRCVDPLRASSFVTDGRDRRHGAARELPFVLDPASVPAQAWSLAAERALHLVRHHILRTAPGPAGTGAAFSSRVGLQRVHVAQPSVGIVMWRVWPGRAVEVRQMRPNKRLHE